MDSQLARPAVSVIIPVYNAETFLPACSESLLGQSFRDWEAVCIDDGSTDASLDILTDYAARDARFRVLTQQNRGLGATRNRGIEEARGGYMAFLDADDMYCPNFLELLYERARQSGADVIMGSTRYESPKCVRQDTIPSIGPYAGNFAKRVVDLPHGGAWNKIYRTSLLRKHTLRFTEGCYWEDNLFTLKVCYYAPVMVTEPNAVYRYIMHDKSIVHHSDLADKRKGDALVVARGIMDFCSVVGCSSQERTAAAAFCLRHFAASENNLADPVYASALESILGASAELDALRCKAQRRARRRRFKEALFSIFTLRTYLLTIAQTLCVLCRE